MTRKKSSIWWWLTRSIIFKTRPKVYITSLMYAMVTPCTNCRFLVSTSMNSWVNMTSLKWSWLWSKMFLIAHIVFIFTSNCQSWFSRMCCYGLCYEISSIRQVIWNTDAMCWWTLSLSHKILDVYACDTTDKLIPSHGICSLSWRSAWRI